MKRLLGIMAVVTAAVLLVSGCTSTGSTPQNRAENTRAIPMTGQLADGSGNVTGTFALQQLVDRDGALSAVGTFTGGVGGRSGSAPLTLAATASTASGGARQSGGCPPLRLQLLPTTVSLLGVSVRFDPSILDLVAAPANLLGQLVCQAGSMVTTALQGSARLVGGSAQQLLGVLNRIIGVLIG